MKSSITLFLILSWQLVFSQTKNQITLNGSAINLIYNTPVDEYEVRIYKRLVGTNPDGTMVLSAPSKSILLNTMNVHNSDGKFSYTFNSTGIKYIMIEITSSNYNNFTNRLIDIEEIKQDTIILFNLIKSNPNVYENGLLDNKFESEKKLMDQLKSEDPQNFEIYTNNSKINATTALVTTGCSISVPDSVYVTHLKNGYNGTTCSGAGFTGYINFQEYISGVIQGEMGSFPYEAKKAQAVAARTYSLHRVLDGLSANCGQAYSFTPNDSSIMAADSTLQQVLTYDGSVCYGHYSARCDGTSTLNANEGVWSGFPSCALSGSSIPYEVSRTCSGHLNCSTTAEPCCEVFIPSKGINNNIYGHGVGLCQRGAQGFAHSPFNYNYIDILNAFYTNVCIANLPGDSIIPTCAGPNITWQNTIGGISSDNLKYIEPTTDGGYILGGISTSNISGDKNENDFDNIPPITNDLWIIKLNSSGSIEWQNTIGGNDEDYLTTIRQTSDGGYIVAAQTQSGISGDKTEAAIGLTDFWVLKLNATGSIEWQNTIGGIDHDYLEDIQQTSDGGYICGGWSFSGISGDKTEFNIGSEDYWVVKLNSIGSVIWQNTIGGSSYDQLHSVKQTPDGGYILAGVSGSDAGGDKTEGSHGAADIWVVKLNSTGGIVWQNTIGASSGESIEEISLTTDGGYILGAGSISGVSGDKTEANIGGNDLWVIKLNETGNIIWQNSIGGTDADLLISIKQTIDKGYLIGCETYSDVSGDKCTPITGSRDIWILKLDSIGIIEWQNELGGIEYETISNAQETSDGGYIIGGSSNSDISGNKAEINLGSYDYWVIKLGGSPCSVTPPISYGIEWQNTIGGLGDELIYSVDKTPDGGFILGGSSTSGVSIDKSTVNFGVEDYWVVKLDECGNKIWDKSYGGAQSDVLDVVKTTSDGGFILGGYSSSGMSGNKSEPLIGGTDIWVIKINSNGDILWQNTIGGTSADVLNSINETSDGGFIIGSQSTSNINGDKSEVCYGLNDYWIIKLNSSGNITWQNTIAGSSLEWIGDVSQTFDGGYILIGSSSSGISADKTEPNMDNPGGLTHYDMWILKLNNTGGIEWQNTIGGDHNDWALSGAQCIDGGYYIGGFSQSPISDDIIENPIGGSGNADYFLLKLNSTGAIDWQNMLGSASHDYGRYALETSDGGFIFAGESLSSGISGDKTIDNFDPTNGDIWTVTTNSIGQITNQFVLGGSGIESINSLTQSNDGGYLLGITSTSPISGNKTEASVGYDYWVVKTFGCVPTTEICNNIDDDCDGVVDDGILETITISAAGPTTFCQGASVLLNASFSGTSVQWKKNGANILGATNSSYLATTKATYTCTTSSLCGSTTSSGIIVNVNKNPTASISAGGPTTFCAGGSVLLTEVPSAGSSYQWYKGASSIAGATLLTYSATTPGNYKCRVTKTTTGCYKNSNTISISVPCKSGAPDSLITVFPNPSNGLFTISFVSINEFGYIKILDLAGKEIKKYNLDEGQTSMEIDLSSYSKGMYIVECNLDNRQYNYKIIKD